MAKGGTIIYSLYASKKKIDSKSLFGEIAVIIRRKNKYSNEKGKFLVLDLWRKTKGKQSLQYDIHLGLKIRQKWEKSTWIMQSLQLRPSGKWHYFQVKVVAYKFLAINSPH
jgi:hypothetical protein